MEITQRNASLNDANILLVWRNHPDIRRFSKQSEIITADEHIAWIEDRIKKIPDEPFYLFESKHEAIGMCRIDRVLGPPNQFELSILVDPDQHSKGVGTRILEMSCKSFFSLHPHESIVAKVKSENLLSKKLFLHAGFSLRTNSGDFLYLEKELN